jgi:hypothetical protein
MDLKYFKLLVSIKKSREKKKTKIKSLFKSYLPQRVDTKKILPPLIGKKRRVQGGWGAAFQGERTKSWEGGL